MALLLHPKYGVNPSIEVCFFCGREPGNVALLGGTIPGEAPKKMVTSIIPCKKCKEEGHGKWIFIVCDGEGSEKYGRFCKLPVDALNPHMDKVEKKKLIENMVCLMREEEFKKMFESQEKGKE